MKGFTRILLPWNKVVEKFEHLSSPYAVPSLRRSIVQAVHDLEAIRVEELTQLLAEVGEGTG